MDHRSLETTHSSVPQMFNLIAPSYDRINRILSFGLDRLWRKKLLSHLPEGDSLSLLDLATGTADQLITLMKSRKITRAVGLDLAADMLQIGSNKIAQTPFANQVTLKLASAMEIPEPSLSFDCVSIAFGIRNFADPVAALNESKRVLKSGGRLLILEFSLPPAGWFRSLYLLYLRKILPRLGSALSKESSAYLYLNQTIEAFPTVDAFASIIKKVGFKSVTIQPLQNGIVTLYIAKK